MLPRQLQLFIFLAFIGAKLMVYAKQVKLTHEEFEARAKQADAEIRFITKDELLNDFLERDESKKGQYEGILSDRWRFVFYAASWCKYCKRLSPRWLKLEKGLPKSPDFKDEMGANGYPTLLLYKNGKQIDEYEGDQKTRPMAIWLLQHVRATEGSREDSREDSQTDNPDSYPSKGDEL